MERVFQDLKYGARMLMQRPGFAVVAVLTIALGMGATTAIFSVVYGVLLRPLPYSNPDELMLLWKEAPEAMRGGIGRAVSANSYEDWRDRNSVFSGVAAYRTRSAGVSASQEDPGEKIDGAAVTVNLFSVLGVQPILGRPFTEQEGKRGNENVILLSYGLWQNRFGGDKGIVGRTIYVDGSQHTVVGVLPTGFEFPLGGGFWVPQPIEILKIQPVPGRRIEFAALQVIARRKPGVTREQAQIAMATLQKRLDEQNDEQRQRRVRTESLLETIVGNVRPILWVFAGAVAFVLLIACVNVANLLLARAASREREVAVRASLGASRGHLIRQLLTESVLLSILGGIGGLLLAYGGVRLFLAYNPGNIPRVDHIRLDVPVLVFSFAVALFTGILFGLAPALASSRVNLMQSLKEGSATSAIGGSWHRNRLRSVLVVTEVAMALVLLVGAGLMLNSFLRMVTLDIGMNTKNVVTARVMPGLRTTNQLGAGLRAGMIDADSANQAVRDAYELVGSIPGVESNAYASSLPPDAQRTQASPLIEGQAVDPEHQQNSYVLDVSHNYFDTLRIALLQGRQFTPEDVAGERNVAIVNEAFVRRFLQNEPPVGKRFLAWNDLWEIVGVVKDVRQGDLREDPGPMIYRPRMTAVVRMGNMAFSMGSFFAARTKGDPVAMVPAIRDRLAQMTRVTVVSLGLLDADVWKAVAQPKFYLLILGVFAGVALTLGAIGIYGVLAYSVSQRTQEIGIRVALGAERRKVFGLVLRQGLVLAVAGVAVGIGASSFLTRYLAAQLFGVTPTDGLTFAAVSAVLVGVAIIACAMPARRATRVDPMVALRYE